MSRMHYFTGWKAVVGDVTEDDLVAQVTELYDHLKAWKDWLDFLQMSTDDPLAKARYDGEQNMLCIVDEMVRGLL